MLNTAVLAALGGSLAREEQKGDFASAESRATQILEEARRSGVPSAIAAALADLSFVRVLQGELLSALDSVAELRTLSPTDADLLLRADTCELWVAYERFNAFPTESGAGAAEIAVRWDGTRDLEQPDARWQGHLREARDTDAKREAQFVYRFLCTLRPARSILDNGRHRPGGMPRSKLLELFAPMLDEVRTDAEATGRAAVAAYSQWCLADLAWRVGERTAANVHLARADQSYSLAEDGAGRALCAMTRADWYAAPFSSPATWNFAIQDSASQSSALAASLESEEFARAAQEPLSESVRSYAASARLFEQAAAARGDATIRLRQAYISMRQGDYESAAVEAAACASRFAELGDRRAAHLARVHHICALIGAGRHANLEDTARQVGVWGARSGSFSYALGLGLLLGRWGRHWLIRGGDYERALIAYRQAAVVFQELGAEANVVQSLVDQATVYQAVGDAAAALGLYEQALDLHAADRAKRPEIGGVTQSRTVMLTADVFQLYVQRMDGDGLERTAGRMGLYMKELNEVPDTIGPENTSASVIPHSSSIEQWALLQLLQSNIQMSTVLAPLYRARRARDAGEEAAADHFLRQADGALQLMGEGLREVLSVAVLVEGRQYAEAATQVRGYLQAGGANAGFTGVLVEAMESVGGELGQHEARLQQVRTQIQALAMFVRVKAYADALPHIETLEKLAGPQWWTHDDRPWLLLSDCGEAWSGVGDFARALASYDMAIEQLESRRRQLGRDELKTALAGDKGAQYLYVLATQAAMRTGAADHALDYCERGKARSLLDLMAGTAATIRAGANEGDDLRRWREQSARLQLTRGLLAQERGRQQPDSARIAQLSSDLSAGEAIVADVEARLAIARPHLQGVLSSTAPTLPAAEIAAAIPADTVLVEYCFAGDLFMGWAVDRSGVRESFETHADTRAIARLIREYHGACAGGRPVDEAARNLSERFLSPVAAALRGSNRIIFVPFGAAHTLPFHALPFEGLPLAARFEVSYLPSASTLRFLRPGRWSCPHEMFAIGNPTGDLPHAETEATYVARLFSAAPLLRDDATEAIVRNRIAEAPLVHLATHGSLDADSPLASSISLADGELTLYDLMGIHLHADLVVLSACETGTGDTTPGDDVFGLSRGLLAAGARSAIVSLWPVEDLATSLLMGAFYRNLQAGYVPSAALRMAQEFVRTLSAADVHNEIARLEQQLEPAGNLASSIHDQRSVRLGRPLAGARTAEYSHPYYWAPFVLVG